MHGDIQIRAASDDDAERIGAFINICTTAYQGRARSSIEDAMARLHFAGSEPSTDALIALEGGQCVGFAHEWRVSSAEVRCFARVHPGAQGKGIGSELLARSETRAREVLAGTRERSTITVTGWARDAAAAPLLRGCGFTPIRHFLSMVIAADDVRGVAAWPKGIALRSLQPGDDDELYAAFQDAFAGHWGTTDDDARAWWTERRDRAPGGQFDPSLWLLAVDGNQIVGFALCELKKDGERTVGRVAEIGVRSHRRGEGIGHAILVSALGLLRDRGAAEITLDVDSDNVTSAIRLYVKAGMVARPAFTVWERELAGVADLGRS